MKIDSTTHRATQPITVNPIGSATDGETRRQVDCAGSPKTTDSLIGLATFRTMFSAVNAATTEALKEIL